MDNNERNKILFKSANKLRGALAAQEYMHVVLGLIFLKYLSDRFVKRKNELIAEGKGFENDSDFYTSKMVFWVPEESRWEFISKFSKEEELGKRLDQAFINIEDVNPSLKNILPKTYSKLEVDKRSLGELVDLFTNELDTTNTEGDFIGKVYEYFMGKFNNKNDGGEYYTPQCIVDLLVNMIKPFEGKVYDPCCGSGGMFVQSAKFVEGHQGSLHDISVYGQEKIATTWRLAKMNLVIRGIEADLGESHGDTFHDDKHKSLRADYILANPPFNIKDYGHDLLLEDPRWNYGTPPEGNANFGWIQHIYSKLSPNGVAGFVLANGSLSTKQEHEIRKAMIEDGVIDCIITLPDKLFLTFKGPTCLWFIRKKQLKEETLFINADNMGVMIDRANRELTSKEIEKITTTYHNWLKDDDYKDEKGFCFSADKNTIKEHDYTLVSARYVGIDTSDELTTEEIETQLKVVGTELKELLKKDEELKVKLNSILEIL
ncbi:MAG: class I SAM-dependent DNA methyltransferase [bacterium]